MDLKHEDILKEEDFYIILGITSTAGKSEIQKAYRKLALKHHPDKNRDDPKAKDIFHKIQTAYEVLNDEKARAAFDDVEKIKMARRRRYHEMDSERRRMKDDLLSREKANTKQKNEEEQAQMKLETEIARLRREGHLKEKKQREEEEEFRQKSKMDSSVSASDRSYFVRVKWKNIDTNSGYTEETLRAIFDAYGPIDDLIISEKRKDRAVLSFRNKADAIDIVNLRAVGPKDNPLFLSFLKKNSDNIKVDYTIPDSKWSPVNDTTRSSDRNEEKSDFIDNMTLERKIMERIQGSSRKKGREEPSRPHYSAQKPTPNQLASFNAYENYTINRLKQAAKKLKQF